MSGRRHSSNVFNRVGKLRPRRSKFDLSYRNNFTCKMGQLIPVMCDEVIPGDFLKIGNELTIRFQPLSAPIMHEITATVHYFFVPYRLLWDKWEEFIVQGDTPPLPLTIPLANFLPNAQMKGSLWDYLGLPFFPRGSGGANSVDATSPIIFPFLAYNKVWNEYYRDENLQEEIKDFYINDDSAVQVNDNILKIRYRNWKKDYFTSALPFRQKGQAPALPVNVDFNNSQDWLPLVLREPITLGTPMYHYPVLNTDQVGPEPSYSPDTRLAIPVASANPIPSDAGHFGIPGNFLSSGLTATTFNVSDLRLSFQIQKWLERNARAGTRYTSFLQAHFGVSPSDARLDRPEYIGGTKQPVIISEVLQTSQTTTDPTAGSPLAQMGGHGLGADAQYVGSYNVQEFGVVIGLLSVMPKPSYQQGINRQWLRRVPTDFYFPEFSHLSEQAIARREIFANWTPSDGNIFGYVGQYDEMRVKHDMVCGEMRIRRDGYNTPWSENDQLSYWNLTRWFRESPNLNSAFISTEGTIPEDRVFAVGGVDTLIVNCVNRIHAVRPLPLIAEPGLVDHF